jgi:hypothetical protein
MVSIQANAGSARYLSPETGRLIFIKEGRKMFGKIKKVFFTGMFGVLYVSFVAQLVYILGWTQSWETKFIGLGFLALEWLILIAARYLSKKSSNNAQYNGGYNNRRR